MNWYSKIEMREGDFRERWMVTGASVGNRKLVADCWYDQVRT